jgi:uncharacterized protein involved in outer membrane biogenesis
LDENSGKTPFSIPQRERKKKPAGSGAPNGGTEVDFKPNYGETKRVFLSSAIALALFLGITVLWVLLKALLRRRVEEHLNSHIKGYSASLGSVRLHPFRSFISLKDLTFGREGYVIPPLVHVPEWQFHLHLRNLLSRNLTVYMVVKRPSVHLDLGKVLAEKA